MLLVPYSSTIATIELRIPVRIEATTIAVIIPTTIPRIVKKERNLCERIESVDIFSTSNGKDVLTRIDQLCVNATIGSRRAAFQAGYSPAMILFRVTAPTE